MLLICIFKNRKKNKYYLKKIGIRNFLEVKWLALRTFSAQGVGSIPGQGTKILQAVWCGQKKKKRVKR